MTLMKKFAVMALIALSALSVGQVIAGTSKTGTTTNHVQSQEACSGPGCYETDPRCWDAPGACKFAIATHPEIKVNTRVACSGPGCYETDPRCWDAPGACKFAVTERATLNMEMKLPKFDTKLACTGPGCYGTDPRCEDSPRACKLTYVDRPALDRRNVV